MGGWGGGPDLHPDLRPLLPSPRISQPHPAICTIRHLAVPCCSLPNSTMPCGTPLYNDIYTPQPSVGPTPGIPIYTTLHATCVHHAITEPFHIIPNHTTVYHATPPSICSRERIQTQTKTEGRPVARFLAYRMLPVMSSESVASAYNADSTGHPPPCLLVSLSNCRICLGKSPCVPGMLTAPPLFHTPLPYLGQPNPHQLTCGSINHGHVHTHSHDHGHAHGYANVHSHAHAHAYNPLFQIPYYGDL